MSVCMEICIDSLDSVKAVDDIVSLGADNRYEVCSNLLSGGGLTPSIGLIRAIRRHFPHAKLMVMIRPRTGDFVWSEAEVETMVEDIRAFAGEGVYGVVIGCLTSDGQVDMVACRRLVQAAGSLQVTFHRAVDVTPDWSQALSDIASIGGISRVLSSGQETSALLGADTLRAMTELCQNVSSCPTGSTASHRSDLNIIAGSGVNERTLETLLNAAPDLCEVHLTASSSTFPTRVTGSVVVQRGEIFGFGSGEQWTIDRKKVKRIWDIISRRNESVSL